MRIYRGALPAMGAALLLGGCAALWGCGAGGGAARSTESEAYPAEAEASGDRGQESAEVAETGAPGEEVAESTEPSARGEKGQGDADADADASEAAESGASGTDDADAGDSGTDAVDAGDADAADADAAIKAWREGHPKVRGIYVTGPMAGSAGMDDLISLVDETELNAMVIDVKNDDGEVTYAMDGDDPRVNDACKEYITDIGAFMEKLKEHDIYTIARVVCFKDPVLALDPECALKKDDGTPVADANGNAFVNPYSEDVWDYIAGIASQAAADGFDEIQFDYVRFPIGKDAEAADYGVDMEEHPKEEAISGFLRYAAGRLHGEGAVFGADVFGTIIESDADAANVGQDYEEIGGIADVLSPMVYPSHYYAGAFGLDVPDARPYETVLAALNGSARKLSGIGEDARAIVRPWLQAFTASWVEGHISYGGDAIRKQINAVYDAGYDEWILWNASNKYSADGLEAG